MQLELVSFKLCPFVQRAIIVLKKQQIDYQLTYINLLNPPDWFKKISPTGQVPLLIVDKRVIFECNAISELVNDVGLIDMHPHPALKKAENRSWIEFSSTLLMDLFNLVIASNEDKFNQAKTHLLAKLSRLEAIKNKAKFFNDNKFCMIDCAFAPFFMRLAWINKFTDDALSLDNLPHLNAWSGALLADDTVQKSVVEGLEDVYYSSIEARDGYLSTLLIE